MGRFSDYPYFLVEEYLSTLKKDDYTPPATSYIMGMNRSIIVNGVYKFKLFVKTDYDFVEAYFVVSSNYKKDKFIEIKCLSDISFDNGLEVYFRKDSNFHNFLKTFSETNYINYMKKFNYFGKMYISNANENKYFIERDSMRDFVLRSLPENNVTPNLEEFISIFFDKIYSEIYYKMKDLPSLLDPLEMDVGFLVYIANKYNIDFKSDFLNEEKLRRYLNDMIFFLKRKGTYTSLYIIYRLVMGNTQNKFNIYDIWHDWGTEFNKSTFEYHNYTNFYDFDGLTYPPKEDYVVDNKYLSTHYLAEVDFSFQAESDDYIVNDKIMSNLIDTWELCRPVNRVSHYRQYLSPIATVENNEYNNLYVNISNNGFCNTKTTFNLSFSSENVYRHTQNIYSNVWTITHGFDSDYHIVQLYDVNKKLINPMNIEYKDGIIEVTFNLVEAGTAFVINKQFYDTYSGTTWNAIHSLNEYLTLTGVHDNSDFVVMPETIKRISDNETEVTFNGSMSGGYIGNKGEFIYDSVSSSSTWNIVHSLQSNELVVQCFKEGIDGKHERILPKRIIFNTLMSCTIEFSEPVQGYAVFRMVSFGENFMDYINDITYIKFGNGGNSNFDAKTVNDINNYIADSIITSSDISLEFNSDGYYTIISKKEDFEMTFNEIGWYDSFNNLLFYTFCSNFYKPEDVDLKLVLRIAGL